MRLKTFLASTPCVRYTSSVRRHFAATGNPPAKAGPLKPHEHLSRTEALQQEVPRHAIETGIRPSPHSCSLIAPGTTRSAANEAATALQRPRRTPVRSYLRHSPRLLGLKHHADLAWHRGPSLAGPGPNSPSRVSDARHPNGHVAWRLSSDLSPYVHAPAWHSFRVCILLEALAISAGRNEKLPRTPRLQV